MKIMLGIIAALVMTVTAKADVIYFKLTEVDTETWLLTTTRTQTSTDTGYFQVKGVTKLTVAGGAHRGIPWGPLDLGAAVDNGSKSGGGPPRKNEYGPLGDQRGFYIHFVNTDIMRTRTYWIQGQFISGKTGLAAGNVYMKGSRDAGFVYAADDSDFGKGSIITPGTGNVTQGSWLLHASAL